MAFSFFRYADDREERDPHRDALKHIAEGTIKAIKNRRYRINNQDYYLHIGDLTACTQFYPVESCLSKWIEHTIPQDVKSAFKPTYVSILEISTLDCARLLATIIKNNHDENGSIGILNFASATKPGGGFLGGAQAQEESIARSSTLYPSLVCDVGRQFYRTHKDISTNCFYTHSMIWSPGVQIFRNDDGAPTPPLEVDVVTCAAVNAKEARERMSRRMGVKKTDSIIESEMQQRMGRILYLFEKKGTKNLVLGSFGTGVFRNDIDVVARLWASLLTTRFRTSFDRVVFAILGEKTFLEFQGIFNACSEGLKDLPLPVSPRPLNASPSTSKLTRSTSRTAERPEYSKPYLSFGCSYLPL